MPKRIPVARAKEVGEKHPDVRQVILVAWDGARTHVVTWGKSLEDCAQAAHAGNLAKQSFGFPEDLCRDEPGRVRLLRKRIVALEAEVARLAARPDRHAGRAEGERRPTSPPCWAPMECDCPNCARPEVTDG